MRRDLPRLSLRSALALTLWSGWFGTACAVTFPTPSSDMADAFVEPSTFVNEYYRFATTSPQSVTTTASVPQANPTANDSFGIAGLNPEWLERGSSAAFADASSVTESTAKLIATLASSDSRDADVYGAALADGGEYSIQLPAKGASPVPLRPAMLLLGSALVGLAFVGLRRRAAQGADPTATEA
jgi:hypothetical protein